MEHTFGFGEDFQKSIVAALLKDPSFLSFYEDVILPGYFDYDYLSSIVRTARELSDKFGELPTKPTMVEEVKSFCSQFGIADDERDLLLNKLEEVYSLDTINIDYIREKVVEFGQRQSMRGAILKIATMFQDPKEAKGDAIYEKARDLLESALRVGVDSRDFGLSLYPKLSELPKLAANSIAGIHKKVSTGFPTIDRHTLGGPGRGELWTVVGLPGRGKSAFLVNIGAVALKQGFAVVHLTIGDLEEIDVGVRYAARLTGATTYQVITGSEEYLKRAAVVGRYDPHLFIKYYPPDTITIAHLRSYLSKLRSVHGVKPAVVIVDYPEELKMRHSNDLYLSGGANYSGMKSMASDFDALFWAASQPKDWNPKNPYDVLRGTNLNESKKKFHKLDGLVSWNMNEEEEMFGRGRLWVDKTRRAKSFYLINCEVDMEKMRIMEVKPPESTNPVAEAAI